MALSGKRLLLAAPALVCLLWLASTLFAGGGHDSVGDGGHHDPFATPSPIAADPPDVNPNMTVVVRGASVNPNTPESPDDSDGGAEGAASPSRALVSVDPAIEEWPKESPDADGAVYNASGHGFVSSIKWQGKCWYRVTNFCVINGELTMFHPPEQSTAVQGGSLRMCNEFSQHSALIRLKYKSVPTPAVLPAPLLTKTQGWVLQFWCQDLFHMTLSLLPAFNTKQFLGDHPDIYVRIAKGKRKKSAYCRIKFGHPLSYDHVRNPRWGDHQFPFPGNPYWPFYESISPDPWRLHPMYKGATAKSACYTKGVIDKLYVKDMTGYHATNYTKALREIMRVPPHEPRTCGKYRVTFIDRRGKTRRLSNVPEIIAMINRDPAFNATAVALETIPIREQLRLMTNTDLLMGMHGNGITWLQFLAPGSVVAELIGVWYQPYAKLWGLKHLHSSMGNNMDFKRQGEYVPFAHNMTEIRGILAAAKAHLDATSCPGPDGAVKTIGPSKVSLDHLYSE
eukprot:CAMPEP_0174837668 /NCGR_PEP_ID=MMETSP1114-20130205/6901_1 /TAXON_ID=312471 /ORGANISM="Neobodo designis, Strain CCAP 1951/1" /LENGTH=508 /DNA_ID=CAMNT_0016071739 /DNA_START=73 /DNA_END=1596 /DNA_ORIENTATION=+